MNISSLSEKGLSLYTYKCQVTSVNDGDSLWGLIDRGFGDHSLRELRLSRIDAYEITGKKKKLGYVAKDFLMQYAPIGSKVIIQSKGFDSFGRLISELWVWHESEWININDLLVTEGHAAYRTYRPNKRRLFHSLAIAALAVKEAA